MFSLSHDLSEIILRAIIIYCAIFALFRLLGKRHVGQLGPFDMVVLLLVSESVSPALNVQETSISGGIVSALAIFGINQLVTYVTTKNRTAERIFEGKAKILVRNGNVRRSVLRSEHVSQSELLEALRRQGITSISKVRYAVLENDGDITVGSRNAPDKQGGD